MDREMTDTDPNDYSDDYLWEGESSLDPHDPWNSIVHTVDELAHVLELAMLKGWTEEHLPGSESLAALLEDPFGIEFLSRNQSENLLPQLPASCVGDFRWLRSGDEQRNLGDELWTVGNWKTKRNLDGLGAAVGFAHWRQDRLASAGSSTETTIDPLSEEFGNFWGFTCPVHRQGTGRWSLFARIGTLLVDLRWEEPSQARELELSLSHKVLRIWNELFWPQIRHHHHIDEGRARPATPFVLVSWCHYEKTGGLFLHDPITADAGSTSQTDTLKDPEDQVIDSAAVLLDGLSELSQPDLPGNHVVGWRPLSLLRTTENKLDHRDEENGHPTRKPRLMDWINRSLANLARTVAARLDQGCKRR